MCDAKREDSFSPPAEYKDADINGAIDSSTYAAPYQTYVDSTFGRVRYFYKHKLATSDCANWSNKRRFSSPLTINDRTHTNTVADNEIFCCTSSPLVVVAADDSTTKLHQQFHENLMKSSIYRYIDTHCHMDLIYQRSGFENGTYSNFKAKYKDTWSPRYLGCIADFCFPNTYLLHEIYNTTFITTLAENDDVWLALGCHPHQADAYDDVLAEFITKQVNESKKIVAIGEMGLDYSSNNQIDHDIQKRTLERQLKLAVDLKKPILLHCRDAYEDCFEIFANVVPSEHPIHWHCFSGTYELSTKWSYKFENLYYGVTTGIYAPRNSYQTDFCRRISLDRLLIETDAPYFLPSHYKTKQFGQLDFNHSGLGALVGLKLAEIRNLEVDHVMEQIYKNTRTLYNIPI